MSTKGIKINSTALYFIAFVVVLLVFLLLGGGPWVKGMMHGNNSMGMTHWNWVLILICTGIGFLLGLLVSRRK